MFITKKLHKTFHLSTYTEDYSNMFPLFLIAIFREHWYTNVLPFYTSAPNFLCTSVHPDDGYKKQRKYVRVVSYKWNVFVLCVDNKSYLYVRT